MESTETLPAPTTSVRKERQLVAGRYRLAALHRTDDSTEVWRALDESAHQVVTLEFLNDRSAPVKERFLADARRMAAIERPAVMKVGAIHDNAADTFVVFEHLVHVPVPLDWLKPDEVPAPVVPAPVVAAAPAAEPVKQAPVMTIAPTPIVPPAPEPTPEPSDETTDMTRELVNPHDRGLAAVMVALRARDLALLDAPMLKEAALEVIALVRAYIKDAHFETVVADVRAYLEQLDWSVLRSVLGKTDVAARRLAGARAQLRMPAMPRVRVALPKVQRAPRVRTVKPKPVAAATPAMPRAPSLRMPRMPRLVPNVRWRRVFWRGLSLGLLAAIIVNLPPDLLTNLSKSAGPAVEQGVKTVSTVVDQGVRTVTAAVDQGVRAATGPRLAPATFELPPLNAYRASFETQGAYPTTRPNGTVEWVVALRNSGSVGWYRGIDGAQASLALSDGTQVAVQSTPFVGPGQVGWFIVRFPAPAQPGTYNISLHPRIDGRGALPDLGIYAVVTVSAN